METMRNPEPDALIRRSVGWAVMFTLIAWCLGVPEGAIGDVLPGPESATPYTESFPEDFEDPFS